VKLADVTGWWRPDPGWLNTASYGLPCRPTLEAIEAALDEWRRGFGPWTSWDESTHRSRVAFARLVQVSTSDVAVGSTVSGFLSVVAAALPDTANVVVPEAEFTSNLFPWLVQEDRGVHVQALPLAEVAEAIGTATDLVAFSLVQSATGEIAPYQQIVQAARTHRALICVDATQAVGWLPVDARDFDVVVCAGYKWLMAPRGAAYCYLSPSVRDRLRPLQAGWYAGEDVHSSYYGPPLRLAADARRFDISPAWFSYVGAAPALELLCQLDPAELRAHNVGLANRFRSGLGLPPADSAIVSTSLPGASERLEAAGIRAAVRGGKLRASFHLYNTGADVDHALNALT
jgi:selenocysteine lyase/cysteine desulfurase